MYTCPSWGQWLKEWNLKRHKYANYRQQWAIKSFVTRRSIDCWILTDVSNKLPSSSSSGNKILTDWSWRLKHYYSWICPWLFTTDKCVKLHDMNLRWHLCKSLHHLLQIILLPNNRIHGAKRKDIVAASILLHMYFRISQYFNLERIS